MSICAHHVCNHLCNIEAHLGGTLHSTATLHLDPRSPADTSRLISLIPTDCGHRCGILSSNRHVARGYALQGLHLSPNYAAVVSDPVASIVCFLFFSLWGKVTRCSCFGHECTFLHWGFLLWAPRWRTPQREQAAWVRVSETVHGRRTDALKYHLIVKHFIFRTFHVGIVHLWVASFKNYYFFVALYQNLYIEIM